MRNRVDRCGAASPQGKAQVVRILDVALLGPSIYIGAAAEDLPPLVRAFSVLYGVATIVYNGRNYVLIREGGRSRRRGRGVKRFPPAERFPHGTRARYVAGCICLSCKAANVAAYHTRQRKETEALAEYVAQQRRRVEATIPPGTPIEIAEARLAAVVECVSGPCPGLHGAGGCPKDRRLRKDSRGGICSYCRSRLVWNGLVDASRARAHLEALSEQGIGRRTVGDAAGVAVTVLHEVRKGRKERIRAQTERRILEVDAGAIADAALVPAGPTKRRIKRLLQLGLTKADIALALGYSAPALQLGKRGRITARNAHRVEKLLRGVEAEAARWERATARALCACGFSHAAVERRAMLPRLTELTFEAAHAEWPCVYPEGVLSRRRFALDARALRRGRWRERQ